MSNTICHLSTGWCAQHDEKTLAPASARVYEKAALSGNEAVGIVRFLMSLASAFAKTVRGIHEKDAEVSDIRRQCHGALAGVTLASSA